MPRPTRMPKWILDRAKSADIPQYMPKPRYLYRHVLVHDLLKVGCRAMYRVWVRTQDGIEEHYVRIDSIAELNEMSDVIRYDGTWSCHFLWFYEYPSWKELEEYEDEHITFINGIPSKKIL